MINLNFEDQMRHLKEIVSTLEKGDLTLEEMLKLYEEGIQTYKSCQNKIDETKSKVEILNQTIVE